jgi:hypothetical protein
MYRKSWRGRTKNSLFNYFLKVVIPLMILIAMLEEANPRCPRYYYWKTKLKIPFVNDFVISEVMKINTHQDREPKDKIAQTDEPNT